MVFYRPVLTERQKVRKNFQYIFINFSAWEYAGSDQLWAGLITTLCDGVESHFGILPMSFYRVVGKKCAIIDAPLDKEWVSKKILFLPLWLATILLIVVAIAVAVLILVVGLPLEDGTGDAISIFESVGATVVGVSAAGAIRGTILVIKNMIITQRVQVERQMNRSDVSSQLGFMSSVKMEVMVITRFIKYMEIFQRKKIRVVLEITNLDKCAPDKVVGVLNAMNILLSDQDAPFISILAVDPSIIVDCVESSLYMKGMANNGYEFLNRIITLPFSVPKMDCETKLHLLRCFIDCKEDLAIDHAESEFMPKSQAEGAPLMQPIIPYMSSNHIERAAIEDNSDIPLIVTNHGCPEQPNPCADKGNKTNALIQKTLNYLFEDSIKEYITDNVIHIRRIVNTIAITIRLMVRKVCKDTVDPKKVATWVVLANQWPCRLSWILQCIEDEQQKRSLAHCGTGGGNDSYEDTLLWEVFEKSLEELDIIKCHIQKLLELDGDPQLFQKLLQCSFRVKDANFHLPFTVNLDFSLKRHMELLRGSHSLLGTKSTNHLTVLSVVNMTVDDVCQEMDRLGLKEENVQVYKKNIRSHNLNGRALICSDNCEIRAVLGMGLGEWTIFSMHFLGVVPQVTPPPSATSAASYGRQENLRPRAGSRNTNVKGSMLSLSLSKENLLGKE
ncbi:NTPase KAP family P-loop domain-containing protein 1-like [Ambystoma mexicanum]|uniref:NTPase KAP family P-loop domain-containing protein 1-like n=1 Tax=Ambystoma mexicanum TaxID=8296 RepID=UPI0037E8F76B